MRREEMLGRPVRLEIGIASLAAQVELVFVRVDHVGVGMLRSAALHDLRQRIRRQLVVMIEQGDELAAWPAPAPHSTPRRCRDSRRRMQTETRIGLVLAQHVLIVSGDVDASSQMQSSQCG